MTTFQNLLFSLPEELMRKVYHFDNTYKEFFDNYPLKLRLREKLLDKNYYTTDISNCVLAVSYTHLTLPTSDLV